MPPLQGITSVRLSFGLYMLAVLALAGLYIHSIHHGIPHDWSSASCMTMAHSFRELGILHLRFVPVQNNLPFGKDPDVYLHWPPLYPIVLSFATRILGESDGTGRWLALLISLLTSLAVVGIARTLYSKTAAWLSGFFFLSMRSTYEAARITLHQPLAMLFATCSVLCFMQAVKGSTRRLLWGTLSIISTVLTIFTAWDPCFVAFGLLATALYLGDRFAIRLSIANVAAALAAFLAVQADYLLAYPQLFADQFSTIAYRMGMKFSGSKVVHLHAITDISQYRVQQSLPTSLQHEITWILVFLGPIALASGIFFVARWMDSDRRFDDKGAWIIGGLGLPWIAWYLLMRNYVSIHYFPLVLATPFLAITAGTTFEYALKWAGSLVEARYVKLAVELAVPLLLVFTIAFHIDTSGDPDTYEDLSAVIKQGMPSDGIVLTPTNTPVVVYYSDRHVVRGVDSPDLLKIALPLAHADFPGNPIYFALEDKDRMLLGNRLDGLTPLARVGVATLYRLP